MSMRKLGRTTDHRMSMLRGQVTFLLEKGRLETTVTRAKEVRRLTEKMITIGKKDTLAARRQAYSLLSGHHEKILPDQREKQAKGKKGEQIVTKNDLVKKLFEEIAPEYADRNGGYTRVMLLGPRRGDGAEMAIVELIQKEKAEKKPAAKKKTTAKKPAATTRKPAAKKTAEEVAVEEEAVVGDDVLIVPNTEETPVGDGVLDVPTEETPVGDAHPGVPTEETPVGDAHPGVPNTEETPAEEAATE